MQRFPPYRSLRGQLVRSRVRPKVDTKYPCISARKFRSQIWKGFSASARRNPTRAAQKRGELSKKLSVRSVSRVVSRHADPEGVSPEKPRRACHVPNGSAALRSTRFARDLLREFGCGGSQPSIPTALYIVAA